VNATDTLPSPAVAVPIVGAPGAVTTGGDNVTTAFDAADGALAPTRFTAITVHVYDLAAVRRPTEIGDLNPIHAPAEPPLLEVHDALYPKMCDPPSFAGAVNATDTLSTPAVATPIVGAPGAVAVAAPAVAPLNAANATPTVASPAIQAV